MALCPRIAASIVVAGLLAWAHPASAESLASLPGAAERTAVERSAQVSAERSAQAATKGTVDEPGEPRPSSSTPRHAAKSPPSWLVPTLHSGAVVLGMRVGASLFWSDAYDVTEVDRNWENFQRAWSSAPAFDTERSFFAWDGDPWALNLFGHGLFGSEVYLRHRQYGHAAWVAVGMVVVWSVVWEYLIEAWHKQPSGIDLLWTPAGGLLMGEGRYQLYRGIRAMRPSTTRHVLLYLVDPLGQLERDLLALDR